VPCAVTHLYTSLIQLALDLSIDYGLTWTSIGPTPSGLEGDIWDHVVPVRCGEQPSLLCLYREMVLRRHLADPSPRSGPSAQCVNSG
jgi:hypothetical protein